MQVLSQLPELPPLRSLVVSLTPRTRRPPARRLAPGLRGSLKELTMRPFYGAGIEWADGLDRELSEHLDHAEVAAVLAQQSWLESKVSVGGTALARVREQLEAAHRELDGA